MASTSHMVQYQLFQCKTTYVTVKMIEGYYEVKKNFKSLLKELPPDYPAKIEVTDCMVCKHQHTFDQLLNILVLLLFLVPV